MLFIIEFLNNIKNNSISFDPLPKNSPNNISDFEIQQIINKQNKNNALVSYD